MMIRKRYGVWLLHGLLLIQSCLWLAPAHAAVYRWLDQQGRVQFGDRPPVDREVHEVPITTHPSGSGADSPSIDRQRRENRQKLLDTYREEREQKSQARKKRAAERAKRKQRCIEAKNQVREYERSSALYRLGPDGKRIFLSKEQFKSALLKARDEAKRRCSEFN